MVETIYGSVSKLTREVGVKEPRAEDREEESNKSDLLIPANGKTLSI